MSPLRRNHHESRLFDRGFCVTLVLALIAAPFVAAEDRLTFVDGSQRTVSIVAISSAGHITLQGSNDVIDLQELRSVSRTVEVVKKPLGAVHVHTIGGGRILAQSATLSDAGCQIGWSLADENKKLLLPVEALRAICFAPGDEGKAAQKALQEALKNTKSEEDRLLVKIDGAVQALDGLLYSVSAEEIVFELDDKKRTLPRSRAYAVVLAGSAATEPKDGQCLVSLHDGSTLFGSLVSLDDSLDGGKLTVRPAGEVAFVLPWDSVVGFTVRSDRVRYLSEMTPTKVVEQAIVGLQRHWRRNLSVDGRPLTLGKKQFASGLGVHSYCLLSYDRPEGFDLLAATIGIDAEAVRGGGDCQFVVLADGEERFRRRMRSTDEPFAMRVDVSGAKQIALVVEPGADLDFSDHADWCDVRLIKATPTKSKR